MLIQFFVINSYIEFTKQNMFYKIYYLYYKS